jgi:hypothetical protein
MPTRPYKEVHAFVLSSACDRSAAQLVGRGRLDERERPTLRIKKT